MSEPDQPAKAIVEVFIAMNERGDRAVSAGESEAAELLRTEWGGNLCRIVKRTYLMSPPRIMEGELEEIPDEPTDLPAASQASHHSG